MADSPPYAITPAILARIEEIGEGALCRNPG